MSLLVLSLLFALQAVPSTNSAPVAAPDPAEVQIGAVLDALNTASTAADIDAYVAVFTPDARFVGTDRTERWTLAQLRAYAEPYFAQGKGWAYVPSDRVVTVADIDCRCIAWFDEQLTNPSYGAARGSGVLRLTPDGWRIAQYVLSLPVPNDVADEVVTLIKRHPDPAPQIAPAP